MLVPLRFRKKQKMQYPGERGPDLIRLQPSTVK